MSVSLCSSCMFVSLLLAPRAVRVRILSSSHHGPHHDRAGEATKTVRQDVLQFLGGTRAHLADADPRPGIVRLTGWGVRLGITRLFGVRV